MLLPCAVVKVLFVRAPGSSPGALTMVGLGGFEPPTSRLSGVRSHQLSYKPTPLPLLPEGWVLANPENGTATRGERLLRKEVIQPHLPIRLPCYDFTPIIGPTFDGSLLCRLGHRLRVFPTFVV